MGSEVKESMPLASSPIAYENEAPGSLLLRASSINGWDSPTLLLRVLAKSSFASKSIDNIIKDKPLYHQALTHLGVKYNPEKNHGYETTWLKHKRCINFKGVFIPSEMLRDKAVAYCHECFIEDGYMPYQFDYKLITACSKHKTKLLTQCPTCKANISWNRSKFDYCSYCNEPFTNAERNTVNIEETQLIEHFLQTKNQESIELLHAFYAALKRFYQFNITAELEHHIAAQAALGVVSSEKLIEQLINEIELSGLHPRAALFSFLGSPVKHVVTTGEQILSTLDRRNQHKDFKDEMDHDVLISLEEASQALAISAHLTKQLIDKKVIKGSKDRYKAPWQISLKSINSLLVKLSQISKASTSGVNVLKLINNPNEPSDFSDVLQKILSGEFKCSSLSLHQGLSDLSVRNHSPKQLLQGVDRNNYVTLKETAALCNTNYASIQKIAKTGFINHTYYEKNSRVKLVSIEDVVAFNATYAIASSLAKSIGAGSTNFALKLIACGIKPVSGPTIDNSGVYLFKKSDFSHLDLQDIAKTEFAPQSLGRPRKDSLKQSFSGISFSSVAKQLDISHQTVKALVNKGLLDESTDTHQHKAVTPQSMDDLVKKLYDKRFLTIDEALTSLEINYDEFYKLFVQTGECKVIDLVFTKLIKKTEIFKAKQMQARYITASEAGKLASTHRSFLPNLEKCGHIKTSKTLKGKQFNIKLYDRVSVMKLMNSP